ncbi:MAG: hypothetical protein QG629_844 [Patescibacteria group bacterium]|nr:hypothetical protein [Patescibacteria group bacterium]
MKYVDRERGAAAGVILGFVSLGGLLLVFVALSAWAISERTTYKSKSDELVAAAVEKNTTEVTAKLEKDFADKEKSPYRTFVGPEEYGSIRIGYPKTWSVYTESGGSSQSLDLYMDPGVVRGSGGNDAVYALRTQVTSQSYADVLQQFTSGASNGATKVAPYKLPSNEKIIGSRIEGVLENQKKGTMIVLPLRDRAIKIWTETDAGKADFDTVILKNLTLVP